MGTHTTIFTITALVAALVASEAQSADDPIHASFIRMLEHQTAETISQDADKRTATGTDALTAAVNETLWTREQEQELLVAANEGEDND